MNLKLQGGTVYDPINNVYGKRMDVFINDGKIIKKNKIKGKINKVIDCRDKIIMPGAIDMHTHIGGGKVNIARMM